MSEKVRPFIRLSWAEASFTMKKINYDWKTFKHMNAAADDSSNAIQSFISRQKALCHALQCSTNTVPLLMEYHPSIPNFNLRGIVHPNCTI